MLLAVLHYAVALFPALVVAFVFFPFCPIFIILLQFLQWEFYLKAFCLMFGAGHQCPCATTASLFQLCSCPGCVASYVRQFFSSFANFVTLCF